MEWCILGTLVAFYTLRAVIIWDMQARQERQAHQARALRRIVDPLLVEEFPGHRMPGRWDGLHPSAKSRYISEKVDWKNEGF